MVQSAREANETKAREWINNVLIPAFQHWAESCDAREPEDIKPTATEPNPLGKTLEWRQKPVSSAHVVTFGEESEFLVMYSYTVRLEVSAQSVIGHIEFVEEGEVKHESRESDILSWNEERIRQDMVVKMCG